MAHTPKHNHLITTHFTLCHNHVKYFTCIWHHLELWFVSSSDFWNRHRQPQHWNANIFCHFDINILARFSNSSRVEKRFVFFIKAALYKSVKSDMIGFKLFFKAGCFLFPLPVRLLALPENTLFWSAKRIYFHITSKYYTSLRVMRSSHRKITFIVSSNIGWVYIMFLNSMLIYCLFFNKSSWTCRTSIN